MSTRKQRIDEYVRTYDARGLANLLVDVEDEQEALVVRTCEAIAKEIETSMSHDGLIVRIPSLEACAAIARRHGGKP